MKVNELNYVQVLLYVSFFLNKILLTLLCFDNIRVVSRDFFKFNSLNFTINYV